MRGDVLVRHNNEDNMGLNGDMFIVKTSIVIYNLNQLYIFKNCLILNDMHSFTYSDQSEGLGQLRKQRNNV